MTSEKRGDASMWPGIVLILLGVVFLLDQFWVLNLGRPISDWWPMVLVAIGVAQLFSRRRRSWVSPFVLIALGVFFQLDRLDLWPWWRVGRFWPLLLIVIGVALLFDRLRPRTSPDALTRSS